MWDAAAKVDGIALNSVLLKGPDQLVSLPKVLFGFRENLVAICGDIREMFHQVRIREEDQHSQRFLWKNAETGEVDIYAMHYDFRCIMLTKLGTVCEEQKCYGIF